MIEYLEELKNRLSKEDAERLNAIYAPKEVAVPPSDAYHSLCVMPDGEIRCYGKVAFSDLPDGDCREVYISSRDCGLSWKEYNVKHGTIGAAVKSPWSGRYLTPAGSDECRSDILRICDGDIFAGNYREVQLPGTVAFPYRLLPLKKIKRWVLAAERDGHAVVYLSDDDGNTWRAVDIPKTDKFEMKPPHKGIRWENSGVEPTVSELADGRLMMILRTSTDYHYVTYSADFGETWSHAVPTAFHSTLTNPYLMRLSSGKILFFYNNTKPLPEQDKEKVFPPLDNDEKGGVWEDVFTNRDSNCIAISSDEGKSWQGFRELYLNPLRNSCDFRTVGGNGSGRDKSVHQFQAIELPNNKILVHVGQHSRVRRLMIFDINWLYEKTRKEDFRGGLENTSTQVYLKSISGGMRSFPGHCAWNRTNGAVPVPDPCGDRSEVVLIKNTNDDRLLNNVQGLVWNFPAAHKGSVRIKLRVNGTGLRVSLLDYWQNPCDITVRDDAVFTDIITKEQTDCESWNEAEIRFDTALNTAVLFINGKQVKQLSAQVSAPNGLCYLHLQTAYAEGDCEGSLIKQLDFCSE